ncbi:F-box domain-containing protein [Abeliophyllum distichum]|uniref:F-box domain-containing protein n=1 Tax=Abeliophyllum distichum TaxID=126358 RepID=A0ABD1U1M4_9LAMI
MDVHEDVLLEILLRLPPKSVFKFRCVSKRWNQIINDSFFLNSYAKQRKGPDGVGRLLALIRCPNGISSPIEIAPMLDNQVDVFVAIYDPNDIGGENHLQLIEMPYTEARSYSAGFSRSSDGLLWYGENNIRQIMKFWMLPKGENGYRRSCTIPRQEWSLVHTVNLDSLRDNYSIISHVKTCMQDYYDLYMIALNPKNPLIVLFSICGTTFVCDIESKSVEPIPYHGPPTNDNLGFYTLYPYFESPFLSSYALQ